MVLMARMFFIQIENAKPITILGVSITE